MGDMQASSFNNWEDPNKAITFAITKGTGVIGDGFSTGSKQMSLFCTY